MQEQLVQVLSQAGSLDAAIRISAEKQMEQWERTRGYHLTLQVTRLT